MLPDAMPVSIHLRKAQYHISQQTTARSCVWANTPTGYAKTGTRRQLELEELHMSEESLGASGAPKDFSKLDLANTAICTSSDRRFMDHKAYQCNSLYGWPEATIDSKVTRQKSLPAPLSCDRLRFPGIIVWFTRLFLQHMGVGWSTGETAKWRRFGRCIHFSLAFPI